MLLQTHKAVDGDDLLNAYNLGFTQTRGLKQVPEKDKHIRNVSPDT